MSGNNWQGNERRAADAQAFTLMVDTREMVEKQEAHMEARFMDVHNELKAQREESEKRHNELTKRIEIMSQSTMSVITEQNTMVKEIHKLFKASIPNEDAVGHRLAHESWIRKEEEDKEFWLKLKQNVINWAVIAALGWGGIAIWTAFLRGPG